jgi:hypothetical protein
MARNRSGKRNKQKVVQERWEKKAECGRVIKDKFEEKNVEMINSKPLRPLNQIQAEYIHNCKTKPYNIATGYAGTSKTYIPTRLAIEQYLKGEVDKIVIVRPAISDSKSLGYFGGDLLTKSKNWILPVLDVLEEFLGKNRVEYMLTKGDIVPVPLETIKGRSFNDSFIIIDEAFESGEIDLDNLPESVETLPEGAHDYSNAFAINVKDKLAAICMYVLDEVGELEEVVLDIAEYDEEVIVSNIWLEDNLDRSELITLAKDIGVKGVAHNTKDTGKIIEKIVSYVDSLIFKEESE